MNALCRCTAVSPTCSRRRPSSSLASSRFSTPHLHHFQRRFHAGARPHRPLQIVARPPILAGPTKPSCSSRIVFAQMCILLYYWENKMMMMMMMLELPAFAYHCSNPSTSPACWTPANLLQLVCCCGPMLG